MTHTITRALLHALALPLLITLQGCSGPEATNAAQAGAPVQSRVGTPATVQAAATLQSVTETKNYDPGPAKAYAGIGDRADVLAGAVLIQDGEDLVSPRLAGVSDPPAVARKIFLAARRTKPD